jgi:hypothetical protein
METLRLILRYAHLIAFAALLGGALVQYVLGTLRINRVMLGGAIGMLVTGVLLAAPLGRELDYTKITVKAVIAVLIFIMVFVVRKKDSIKAGHFHAIVGMTLLNAAIAVFWR